MPDQPLKPLTPEEREAISQEAVEGILETSEALLALMRDKHRKKKGTSSESPRAFSSPLLSMIHVHSRLVAAQAALLEECIEIVLPESRLLAQPLRHAFRAGGGGEDVTPLEAVLGSLPARHRQAEWLDQPGIVLVIQQDLPPTDAVEGDTGVLLRRGYCLLMDGRLIEVSEMQTWRMRDQAHHRTGSTIVGTRVVKAEDVVNGAGVEIPLEHLRGELDHGFKVLEGRHVPDLAERRARFDALLAEYSRLLENHLAALKRLGDSPA